MSRRMPKSDNRTAIFDDKYLVGSSFKLNQREARIPSRKVPMSAQRQWVPRMPV